jgi:ferrous iron transport protein B
MNNRKWFWAAIGYQCGLAYIVPLCIYQFGMLFTGHFGFGTVIAFLLTIGFVFMLFRKGVTNEKLKIVVCNLCFFSTSIDYLQ